jgi:(S)-2-hydroxyglutarate dehydrogenase
VNRADVVIVGGGLIGLATALDLLERKPDLRVTVAEKETALARHQSGRNSGVIHAGLYYPPGSLKARLCREGRSKLLRFADEHGIPYRLCGKLVVASNDAELGPLEELHRRGVENGLAGIRELGAAELVEIEPNVTGVRALHVPESGVIDYRQVAQVYVDQVRARGGDVRFGAPVHAIDSRSTGVLVSLGADEVEAACVITCAGLQSDRVARLTGSDSSDYRIVPFRGDYFTLAPPARSLVRGLVYPVPDPSFPFLGVHFTPRLDGEVWAGPNAVPAFAREGYSRFAFNLRDTSDTVRFPGFARLARRYVRMGATEIWRDLSKPAAVKAMQRYVPALEGRDVRFGPCGIRAQCMKSDGTLVDDFLFAETERVLHVVNAPSPGATASLAIGGMLGRRAAEQFGLDA